MAYRFQLYRTAFLHKTPKDYTSLGVFTVTELFEKFTDEDINVPQVLANFRNKVSRFFREFEHLADYEEDVPHCHFFPKEGAKSSVLGYSVTLPGCELKP